MNINIENIDIRYFSREGNSKNILNRDKEVFKALVLETFPECPIMFITLCWPYGHQSIPMSKGLSYSKENSLSAVQWEEDIFYNEKLWKQVFKWVKDSHVPLDQIPFSIFGRGFDDYPYQSKFAPALDDRFFVSYVLPRTKDAFNRFLLWVAKSSEELEDFFSWPLDKSVSDIDSEAQRFHALFLKAPKKLWDNSAGRPKIIEDNSVSEPIEMFLRNEIAEINQLGGRFNFKVSLNQIEKLPCIFPIWVSPLDAKPVFYAKGKAARSWAEVCALRARLIRLSEVPLFYEGAKIALPDLEKAFLLDHDVDICKLAFNPMEELRDYLDIMQKKYSVLKRELSNSVFKE